MKSTPISLAILLLAVAAVQSWGGPPPPPGGPFGRPGGGPPGGPFGRPPPGGPFRPPPGGPHGPHGPPPPCPADPTRVKEAENKKLALDLFNKVFGDKDVDALDTLVCPDIIEHNPDTPDGVQAFKDILNSIPKFQQKIKETIEVTQINAEGDMVWTQRREINPVTGKVRSIIDQSKYCDRPGRPTRCVCEHWDTMQDIPDNAVSTHPMFS